MKKLIVLTGICSLLVALPAMAGPAGGGADGKGKGKGAGKPGAPGGKGGERPSPEEMVKKLDTDQSGGISLAEFKAGPMAQRAQDPKMVEERFNHMDANGDGTVTGEELAAAFKKMQGAKGKGVRPEAGKSRPEGGKGKSRPERPAAE